MSEKVHEETLTLQYTCHRITGIDVYLQYGTIETQHFSSKRRCGASGQTHDDENTETREIERK
jgi:hypothetical protein